MWVTTRRVGPGAARVPALRAQWRGDTCEGGAAATISGPHGIRKSLKGLKGIECSASPTELARMRPVAGSKSCVWLGLGKDGCAKQLPMAYQQRHGQGAEPV